jgi:hypothetical protein
VLQGKNRSDGLGLVSDGVSERVDGSVDQFWPEPVAGIGRMQVGDDLQFVAKRDRGLVLEGDPQRCA